MGKEYIIGGPQTVSGWSALEGALHDRCGVETHMEGRRTFVNIPEDGGATRSRILALGIQLDPATPSGVTETAQGYLDLCKAATIGDKQPSAFAKAARGEL